MVCPSKARNQMKRQSYHRMFKSEADAIEACRIRNQSYKAAGNHRDLVVVIEGPSNDWAVMDATSAIEMEVPYSWYV